MADEGEHVGDEERPATAQDRRAPVAQLVDDPAEGEAGDAAQARGVEEDGDQRGHGQRGGVGARVGRVADSAVPGLQHRPRV